MDIFHLLGVVVSLLAGIIIAFWAIALSLQYVLEKAEIMGIVVEYAIYRKHFHKWREENKEMRPDGSFPAH